MDFTMVNMQFNWAFIAIWVAAVKYFWDFDVLQYL